MRLHFDSNLLIQRNQELHLEDVKYLKDRCRINIMNARSGKSLAEFKNLLLTKSPAWEYEEEYRLFINPSECFEKPDNIFYKFNPKSLIRIDLGVNCKNEDIKTQLEREELKHVELYKAEIDEEEFKLKYTRIN